MSYRTSNNVSNLELFRARNWSQVSEFLCACQASTCAAAAAVAAAVAAVAAVREQGKISSVGNVHAPTNGFIDDIRTKNVVHRTHIFMVFFLLVQMKLSIPNPKPVLPIIDHVQQRQNP